MPPVFAASYLPPISLHFVPDAPLFVREIKLASFGAPFEFATRVWEDSVLFFAPPPPPSFVFFSHPRPKLGETDPIA